MIEEILSLAWIPLVTAFIGWLTNWVAVRMLFHPRQSIRALGTEMQGLIPKRQNELAEKIGDIVEKEFVSGHTIRKQLEAVDFKPYFKEFVQRLIHQNLGQKLKTIPLVGTMINDSTLGMLENMATEAMQEEVEPLKEKLATEIESRMQIRDVVYKRVSEFELEKLEAIVTKVAQKEFRAIEILGGVLGFVVGVAQLVILLAIR